MKNDIDILKIEYEDAYNNYMYWQNKLDNLKNRSHVLNDMNLTGKCIRICESKLDKIYNTGTYIRVRGVAFIAGNVRISGYGFRSIFDKETNIFSVNVKDTIMYEFNILELEDELKKITEITKEEFDSIFDKMIEDMRYFHQKQEGI